METVKFTPNQNNIEARKKIVPFGRASEHSPESINTIKFLVAGANENTAEEVIATQKKEESTGVYRAPVIGAKAATIVTTEVSVKITNIPATIDSTDTLSKLLKLRCGNSYNFCRLIFDKETRKSRGLAYVVCKDQEEAVKFTKLASEIIVENMRLCVEVVDSH
ncbi:hypothetical protein ENBRE01_1960 [Enteropsectra breve]|nr:hypothetical protein ENBRE01_1960 [Enteropsectra breve]